MARRYFYRQLSAVLNPFSDQPELRVQDVEVTLCPDSLLDGVNPEAFYEAHRGRKDQLIDIDLPKAHPEDLTHTLRALITSVSFIDEEDA